VGSGAKSQPTNDWCILESKTAALVAAVFVDFPENKCANSCLRSIPHRAAPYEELFFLGQEVYVWNNSDLVTVTTNSRRTTTSSIQQQTFSE